MRGVGGPGGLPLRRVEAGEGEEPVSVQGAFAAASAATVPRHPPGYRRPPCISAANCEGRPCAVFPLRSRCRHRSCRDSRRPAPRACASGHGPTGCGSGGHLDPWHSRSHCERCSAGRPSRRPRERPARPRAPSTITNSGRLSPRASRSSRCGGPWPQMRPRKPPERAHAAALSPPLRRENGAPRRFLIRAHS